MRPSRNITSQQDDKRKKGPEASASSLSATAHANAAAAAQQLRSSILNRLSPTLSSTGTTGSAASPLRPPAMDLATATDDETAGFASSAVRELPTVPPSLQQGPGQPVPSAPTRQFTNSLLTGRVPRSEDITREQLEHYATTLASVHRVSPLSQRARSRRTPVLLKRLDENVRSLKRANDVIYEAVMTQRRINPTEEWLMDNYYLIEEQIRLGKKHLPSGYSREMPQLLNGPVAGLPRVYGLVLELIQLVNGKITEENVRIFVDAYQSVSPLNLGELWGIPIMLRLGLLENIRQVSEEILKRRDDSNTADSWADQLIAAAEKNSKEVIGVLSHMSQSVADISNAFVIQMISRLQGSDPLLSVITTWLQQQLSTQGLDIDYIYRTMRHSLHEDQVSMSNSIQSLRFVNICDWSTFVESLSRVEAILLQDPSETYVLQNFESRDRCRHAIESLSKHNLRSEEEIALLALDMAKRAKSQYDAMYGSIDNTGPQVPFYKQAPRGQDMEQALAFRKCHISHWLMDDDGMLELIVTNELKRGLIDNFMQVLGNAYFALIGLISLVFYVALCKYAEIESSLAWLLLALPLMLSGSQLAVALSNRVMTMMAGPRVPPRMDFSEGIPDEERTMVIVPTMLTSADGVKELVQDLLARYLVNRDKNLTYALLTDFTDAQQETMPTDQQLADLCAEGINELNETYPPEEGAPNKTVFYLFNRKRKWNDTDKLWMGWERKRGKLTDFNRLLRSSGAETEPYTHIVGDTSILGSIKYCITLDTDTMLPPDSGRKLVGTAAHVLNQPIVDPRQGRVVKGYGVLQPRVSVALTGAYRSLYALMNSLDSGLDPYTREVSDVYQDVFGEGSFIGKGLYVVEQFETVLGEKFPDDRILSHDLLEGCYTRSGLVSDVELFEEFPSSYMVDASRKHRWVRGDWQIAEWAVLGSVPGYKNRRDKNSLTVLSRWKIFDNLRRSLVPLSMICVMLSGWMMPWPAPIVLTTGILSCFLIPVVLSIIDELIHKQQDVSIKQHLSLVAQSFMYRMLDLFSQVMFLPYEAYSSVDAAVRSMWRMYVSNKLLLQWTTSTSAARAYSKASSSEQLRILFHMMWIEPVMGAVILSIVLIRALFWGVGTASMLTCWFLVAGWMSAPLVAWWLSKPMQPEQFQAVEEPLSEDDNKFLRVLSRRTWRYFETFGCTPEDNYLVLDNLQEFPGPSPARRTSPTNLGFALLANITAWDFGYLGMGKAIERTALTLQSMGQLERYRGHFFNWYDTSNQRTLLPKYVSSVDSGNLVAMLLLLRVGLQEFNDAPVLPKQTYQGIRDTLLCLHDTVRKAERDAAEQGDTDAEFLGDLRLIARHASAATQRIDKDPATPADTLNWLNNAQEVAKQLVNVTSTALDKLLRRDEGESEDLDEETMPAEDRELHVEEETREEKQLLAWAEIFDQHIESAKAEILELAPWLALWPVPAQLKSLAATSDADKAHVELFQVLIRTLQDLHNTNVSQIKSLSKTYEPVLRRVAALSAVSSDAQAQNWLERLSHSLRSAAETASARLDKVAQLVELIETDFVKQDFSFLYNSKRKLLHIGFNVDHNRADGSYYDQLCSEARLTSYVAIAQGQLPVTHWFHLGRLMTSIGRDACLLSWSGSMFEYLMPMLFMPSYKGTLLDSTLHAVVTRQMEYGQQKKVGVWGISESAYNLMDQGLIYQYGPFGVPGLGLKRGLSDDLVISPYSGVLALMVKPYGACQNLKRLARHWNCLGDYGMIESLDFTPHRLRGDILAQPIRSYFAHHSGMSFSALAYLLLDKPMQRRFVSDPSLRANELLLQEKVPRLVFVTKPNENETNRWKIAKHQPPAATRIYQGLQTTYPEVHLLSNGSLHVMLSVNGGGYIRYKNMAVTRWREDVTLDGYGVSVYLRDKGSPDVWSATSTPVLAPTDLNYSVVFSQGRAEFRRRHKDIMARTIVSVSPYDDVEVRRVVLTNLNMQEQSQIEITTFGEIILGDPRADAAHRAFNNLFVETEVLRDYSAILCSRRPRAHNEKKPFAFHIMFLNDPRLALGRRSFETDRYRFIGRSGSMQRPSCMAKEHLSDLDGFPLDPVMAIRQAVQIRGGSSVTIDIITGVAKTREEAIEVIRKYQHRRVIDRVLNFSWISSQRLAFELGITEIEAQLFGKLASSILYGNPRYRASLGMLAKNRRGQNGLWRFGISGDLPIMLVRLNDVENLSLMRQCLQAHTYLRFKGVQVDLVIWNNETTSYRDDLQHQLLNLLASRQETTELLGKPGGVHIIRGDQLNEEDGILIYTCARCVFSDNGGSLVEQIEARRYNKESTVPDFSPHTGSTAIIPRGLFGHATGAHHQHGTHGHDIATTSMSMSSTPTMEPSYPPQLILANHLGGFNADGSEYIITIDPKRGIHTPNPWSNLLANERFGSVVSERGAAYSWFDNAHEYRLTPWNNDPLTDGSGEAFYIRDEETGKFWSPLPQPCPSASPYVVRHGMGYSVWEHTTADDLRSEVTTFVPINEPIKIVLIKIHNKGEASRKLSVTGFVEWTLGELRDRTYPYVVTDVENTFTGSAILARNSFSIEYSNFFSFFMVVGYPCTVTADRSEFIGFNRTMASPLAMGKQYLSGTVGAALDPCAAIQINPVTVERGKSIEVAFVLGAQPFRDQALDLVQRIRSNLIIRQLLQNVQNFWRHTLDAVRVETPDPTIDMLANHWLVYQVISSRIWGRSGYYQSSGAFGFRDQLQDSMAVVHHCPHITRQQIIRCCEHQFEEGDVLHWWHSHPTGGLDKGVRTHFSDDLLWLPLALAYYVRVTGDVALATEVRPHWVQGPPLDPKQESLYFQPERTRETASVYEHCKRTIQLGLKRIGQHGIPLIGCGDWNDSFNEIGKDGKGESVWMAFFLSKVMEEFEEVCRHPSVNDQDFIKEMHAARAELKDAVEKNTWDGEWYRRAFFDDGTPLGSAENDECQIDALSQSWACMSDVGDPERVRLALETAYRRLVRKDLSLIQLFDPPFDKGLKWPGYAKGYAPGVRENGGQYTHAAIWMVWAFAHAANKEAVDGSQSLAHKYRDRSWKMFDLINPINHALTPEQVEEYRVEPYVITADVYTLRSREGQGGWSWYTGSAGWFYRLILEQLLGVRREGNRLVFQPCPRPRWKSWKVHYRFGQSVYDITFTKNPSVDSIVVKVDGEVVPQAGSKDLQDEHAETQAEESATPLSSLSGASASSAASAAASVSPAGITLVDGNRHYEVEVQVPNPHVAIPRSISSPSLAQYNYEMAMMNPSGF